MKKYLVHNILVTPFLIIRIPMVLMSWGLTWLATNFENLADKIPAWKR